MEFMLVFAPVFSKREGTSNYSLIQSKVIEGYDCLDVVNLEEIIKNLHPSATKCYIHEILFYEDNTKKKLRYTVDIT